MGVLCGPFGFPVRRAGIALGEKCVDPRNPLVGIVRIDFLGEERLGFLQLACIAP